MWTVCQVASSDRKAVVMDRSGDEFGPLFGTLVGWFWLRMFRLLLLMESASRVPLEIAWSSSV